MQDQVCNAETFLRFLENVLIQYPTGKIIMILGNARIHHAKLIQPFLKEHKEHLELLYLPTYYSQTVFTTKIVNLENTYMPLKHNIHYDLVYQNQYVVAE